LLKKTLVPIAPLLVVGALAILPATASADSFYSCPVGATSLSYCQQVKFCVVPTLRGLTETQAKNALRAHDCGIGDVRNAARHDNTLPAGRVLRASPQGGSVREAGFAVDLVLNPRRGRRCFGLGC
jgi:hypothetical protein